MPAGVELAAAGGGVDAGEQQARGDALQIADDCAVHVAAENVVSIA